MSTDLARKLAAALIDDGHIDELHPRYSHASSVEAQIALMLDRAGLAEMLELLSKTTHEGMGDAQNADAWEQRAKGRIVELLQRAETAEAEVQRLRGQHLYDGCDICRDGYAAMRQRAEAAERELEGLKHVRCPHCAKMGLQAAAMGAQLAVAQQRMSEWDGLRDWAQENLDAGRWAGFHLAHAIQTEVAEAQQREAWWRELDRNYQGPSWESSRVIELRRLLGLDAPPTDGAEEK